jgi:hypothetical protein
MKKPDIGNKVLLPPPQQRGVQAIRTGITIIPV